MFVFYIAIGVMAWSARAIVVFAVNDIIEDSKLEDDE